LLKQFDRILAMPEIRYMGNLKIGQHGDLKLDQLRRAGFQAFEVTTGAQQNNWLGLPGEDLEGVYQANDIVFHYNLLPRHADWAPEIRRNVGVIGMGNVMLDIVHYLKLETGAQTVTAFARRGPTEVKFDKQTLAPVASCLDLPEIRQAVDTAEPQVRAVGKNVEAFYDLLAKAQAKAADCDSGLTFQLQFLHSPRRLLGDEKGRVRAVVFERNRLVREGDKVVSHGTGKTITVPLDTVIFSIGSRVDEGFGLPTSHGNYVTTPKPRFPVDGISYEVYNPDLCAECEDIFVSGWARVASEGIVGLARKDAERGARAVLGYLDTLPTGQAESVDQALADLPRLQNRVVRLADLQRLSDVEQRIAKARGLPTFKFGTEAEMLKAIEGD
jgi:ferredoxin--NADP+ reductase